MRLLLRLYLEKIDATKKKYKELKEQMDKSGVDLSLLDELVLKFA